MLLSSSFTLPVNDPSAIVLTQVKVNAYTGQVVVVDVLEDAIATATRQTTH
jgi:hypothetical protein